MSIAESKTYAKKYAKLSLQAFTGILLLVLLINIAAAQLVNKWFSAANVSWGAIILFVDVAVSILFFYSQKDYLFVSKDVVNSTADKILEKAPATAFDQTNESKKQLEGILHGVSDGITAQKTTGEIIYVNRAGARLCGFNSPEEMMQTPPWKILNKFEIFNESGVPLSFADLPGRAALQGESPPEKIIKFSYKDTGEERWAKVKASPVFDQNGQVMLAVNIFNDITQEKIIKEAQIRAGEQSLVLDTILSKAPIGFALFSLDCRFLRINHWLAEINGLPVSDHIGKTARELLPNIAGSLETAIKKVIETGQPIIDSEVSGETPAFPGKIRHWLESFYPIYTKNQELLGVGVIVHEITQQKEAEKEIRFHAFHDVLTGLPNRKSFEKVLANALEHAKAEGEKLAVLFLDVDRLKNINDSLGHSIGDVVLDEVAARIKQVLRKEDLIARWGGDEFVVVIPGVASLGEVKRVAQKILDILEPALRVQDHSLNIGASIGIAIFPEDGLDSGLLQKNADVALYRAKDSGRNRFEFYHKAMNVHAGENLALEGDLRRAVVQNELNLYYQPIYDFKSQSITSVEALLRWQHPTLGLIKPNKFISLAEQTGTIVPIGEWVVKNACQHLKEWQKLGLKLSMSINLSGRQLNEDSLVERLLQILRENEMDLSLFEMEITESLAMENVDRTKNKLSELKAQGLSIIIDDFGTGYSSLNYLKRFPIDKLKIDKSFVKHCITDEQDTSIIKAIISMAKSLNLKVIAEGVDTEMQMGLLSSLGCDSAQGYLISRPLSRHELVDFLQTKKQADAVKI